jgi:diguanylate cyclase (GGDEF)-like protein
MSKVKVAPESNAARARFLRLSRESQWVLLALVVGVSIWTEPALATRPLYLGTLALTLVLVLLVAVTDWFARVTRRRRMFEQASYVVLLSVLIVLAGPTLRVFMFAFALPAALAPLLVGERDGRVVLGVAAIAVLVIAGAAWPSVGRIAPIEAVTAITVMAFVHYLSSELVKAFAGARRHMMALSARDGLTSAHTFTSFMTLAQQVHEQALNYRSPYAVLIVDIDDLRGINERFGYDAGSRAIRLVATAIERLRAADDLIARYDGDKLAILLPQIEGRRVSELAQRIRNVVFATTLNVDTQVVRIKANVGMARYPLEGTTLNELLVKAEADMRLDRAGREPPKGKPVFKRRSGTKSS